MPDGLGRRRRALDLGGTIRETSVAETLSRARAHLRAFGITRVANITGLDHVGIPTWVVVRPLARSLSVSQGKGLTHELAQASALMECIEIHHAEHFVPRGIAISMREAAVAPGFVNPVLMPIRPKVHVSDDSIAEWIEGENLGTGDRTWIPRDCVDLDSVSTRDQPRVFVGSSNGLASGNTRSEAVLHGVCEVIERDQDSFWHARAQCLGEGRTNRLDLDSVTDEHCRWLLEKCDDAGLDVAVWYVTQTLRVPCFACTVFDSHGRTFYPQRAGGAGCHPYRRVALCRAITEALQSRLAHISGGRDDMYWRLYRDQLRVDDTAGSAWAEILRRERGTIDYENVEEAPRAERVADLLSWTVQCLHAEGFDDVIVVELTQPGVGIPVVHIAVPGLEFPLLKPGYTPGPRMQQFLKQQLGS